MNRQLSIILFLLAGGTIANYSTPSWSSDSTTASIRLDIKEPYWLIEISKESFRRIFKKLEKGDHLQVTMKRLESGFKILEREPYFRSLGFHWHKNDDKSMCKIYGVRRNLSTNSRELDLSKHFATIERRNGSCKDNGGHLRAMVQQHRQKLILTNRYIGSNFDATDISKINLGDFPSMLLDEFRIAYSVPEFTFEASIAKPKSLGIRKFLVTTPVYLGMLKGEISAKWVASLPSGEYRVAATEVAGNSLAGAGVDKYIVRASVVPDNLGGYKVGAMTVMASVPGTTLEAAGVNKFSIMEKGKLAALFMQKGGFVIKGYPRVSVENMKNIGIQRYWASAPIKFDQSLAGNLVGERKVFSDMVSGFLKKAKEEMTSRHKLNIVGWQKIEEKEVGLMNVPKLGKLEAAKEIAFKIYNSKEYGMLVASICSDDFLRGLSSCILPIFKRKNVQSDTK